jgi:hypothetical protein
MSACIRTVYYYVILGDSKGTVHAWHGSVCYYLVPQSLDATDKLTLVHTTSIVTVLETFSLALFSAASARGHWKSPFPLAVIQEPPVEIAFPLAVS